MFTKIEAGALVAALTERMADAARRDEDAAAMYDCTGVFTSIPDPFGAEGRFFVVAEGVDGVPKILTADDLDDFGVLP